MQIFLSDSMQISLLASLKIINSCHYQGFNLSTPVKSLFLLTLVPKIWSSNHWIFAFSSLSLFFLFFMFHFLLSLFFILSSFFCSLTLSFFYSLPLSFSLIKHYLRLHSRLKACDTWSIKIWKWKQSEANKK